MTVMKTRRLPRRARGHPVRIAHLVLAGALCVAPVQAQERALPRSIAEVRLSYAPLVEKVSPAVVNIYTRRVVARRARPFFSDPFFERFFGDMFPGVPRDRVERSLGSGVIVSPDGVIVTNHHVIEDSDEITVSLADRREFDAELVGGDEASDLAVLRIDAGGESLPALELGDSDAVAVGDIVLAIGNPFGVGQTVTGGIVSAKARTGPKGGAFIQTDAAINPGNSGGALVTLDGRLIGVNSVILSRSGGSIGIGFAIPSNLVRVAVEGMTTAGRMVRPWIGVEVQPVTADLARGLGLERPAGVLVRRLHPASPADLSVGDVVLAIDGHEVFDADGLDFRLATRRLGETATLTVIGRSGGREARLPLIEAPEDPPRNLAPLEGDHPLSGATVANLSPALALERGFDPMALGVVVVALRGGPAARLGLRPGDVIVSLAGEAVETVAGLSRLLSRERDEWPITVRRADELLRVTVRG